MMDGDDELDPPLPCGTEPDKPAPPLPRKSAGTPAADEPGPATDEGA